MPKDRAEVQDQYKIGGGSLNEYEFNQGKGEMEEQERQSPEGGHAEGLHGADEPNAPQNVAERIRQVEERAHEIVERRRAKQSGGAASKKSSGKSAKKSAGKSAKKSAAKAAKKAAGKSGASKASGKKGASKSAGKKSGGSKKGVSKKGAGKKGAGKKGSSKKAGGRR